MLVVFGDEFSSHFYNKGCLHTVLDVCFYDGYDCARKRVYILSHTCVV